MTEPVDLQEFVGGFVIEADELIAAATAALLEIETANATRTSSPRAVRDLFRALHTLKGLAGMVGVEPIVDLTHALEAVIRDADRSGGRLHARAVEVALQTVQAITERVRAVAEQRPAAAPPEPLILAIASLEQDGEPAAAPPTVATPWDARLSASERQQVAIALQRGAQVWSLAFVPSEDNAARGVTIATVRAALAVLGDIVKVLPSATPQGVAFEVLIVSSAAPEALAAAAATTADKVVAIAPPTAAPASPVVFDEPVAPEPEASPLARSVVRVELARLDDLQEQLSLLIVSRFQLAREIAAQAERGTDVRRLREIAELQVRQLRDLRRAILRARMVRVGEVLEPLALLVRNLVKSGRNEARLAIDTRDAEIDKAVADRLLPAIVHLVRNAVDHAIEPAAERAARGKPAAGTVRIACTEIAGNRLLLTVSDDGRGIDREAIARRTGRPIGDDRALLDVLTTPGFSTRDTATQISGRGLGLDIVQRIANELGAELSLTTTTGNGDGDGAPSGTTFRLSVPLTIAIADVFSFECGGQAFVVPVAGIDEIFELGREREISPPGSGRAGVAISLLERRGRAMPLIALGDLLAAGVPAGDAGTARARSAIVIRSDEQPIAFAVDRMIGRQEVVVRPIVDPLVRVPGVAGATDLGDGRPTLVLDLGELGRTAGARPAQGALS